MKKVYLIDKQGEFVGHYHIMHSLAAIPGTEELDSTEEVISIRSPFKCVKERIRVIKHCLSESVRRSQGAGCIAHFITADKFYYFYWLFPGKLLKENVIFTIHGVPDGRIKMYLLKRAAHRINKIIVLSDYIKERLLESGITNVESIQHPSFYDYSDIASKAELKHCRGVENRIVLSFLGATRVDKGLDLVFDAICMLPKEIRKRIVLNIAGKATDVSHEFCMNRALEAGCEVLDNMRVLSEKEFKESVRISDVILVPYCRSFNNVSGPMSEAFALGVPCIIPDHGIFQSYRGIQGYDMSFETENAESLATKIGDVIEAIEDGKLRPKVTEDFVLSTFLRRHREIYSCDGGI
ncbi:glycosyltransferase [Parabacteroides distasonis]|jgi:hypothetical protein fulcA4_08107|uniref:glycosyltransferase n=1 Tax=Parabacteroides distasonis TaxID=823 RepID=UPI0039B59515